MTSILIPAAQYLRMSTEHQQYSLENQSSVIERYAESHGLRIVHTYADAARTGVVLKRRSGLRQLLQDVVSGNAPYKVILVYDVSRWGRFLDTDESAHYEFVCKSAGVPVHYCAEPFANDGSLHSLIMKALKRAMAGEYSRELGVKVLAGQRRLASMGFKQGGYPVLVCGVCSFLRIDSRNSVWLSESGKTLRPTESSWYLDRNMKSKSSETSIECSSTNDCRWKRIRCGHMQICMGQARS